MSARRDRVRRVFMPLFVGLMGLAALSNAASRPRFTAFRTVDVVQLIASGMCFGAALVAFVTGRRSS